MDKRCFSCGSTDDVCFFPPEEEFFCELCREQWAVEHGEGDLNES